MKEREYRSLSLSGGETLHGEQIRVNSVGSEPAELSGFEKSF